MKFKEIKYPVILFTKGFFVGYLLPLAALTLEDNIHGIGSIRAICSIHHHISPLIFGIICAFVGLTYANTIKKQKILEKKQLEYNQTLETVAHGTDVGLFLLSKDFKIEWANEAVLKQTGLTFDQIVGETCFKVTHKIDKSCEGPDDICPLNTVDKTGKPITVVHKHYDNKNKAIFVEVSALPITDKNGNITKYVHTSRDITIQKKAQDIINSENEKYFKFFNEAPFGLYTSTIAGIILNANPTFTHMLGYESIEELKGLNIYDLYFDEKQRKSTKKELSENNSIEKKEMYFIKKDASIKHCSVTLRQNNDTVTGVLNEYDKSNILNFCCYCKKIRHGDSETGVWTEPDKYLAKHSDYTPSHGICSDCFENVLQEHQDKS